MIQVNVLSALIKLLHQKVISQYQEADRAICGSGDFTLKPEYAQQRLTIDVWMIMTEVQQQRARAACFTVLKNATAGMLKSVSMDGDLTVNYKPGAGKKINQRKRPCTERTVTVNAKLHHF